MGFNCWWSTSTFENSCWVYCPGHAGVKANDRADRPAGKATLTSGLLLGRPEALRSLRHYLQTQSQGHHTIDRLRREVLKEEAPDDIPWKDEKGPSSIRRTLEPFQRQRWGNFWDRRGEAHMGFSERIDTILNWTELCRTNGQLNFIASRFGLFFPVNSDCARQFSNRCGICEVSKVVHGNRSDRWPTNK